MYCGDLEFCGELLIFCELKKPPAVLLAPSCPCERGCKVTGPGQCSPGMSTGASCRSGLGAHIGRLPEFEKVEMPAAVSPWK